MEGGDWPHSATVHPLLLAYGDSKLQIIAKGTAQPRCPHDRPRLPGAAQGSLKRCSQAVAARLLARSQVQRCSIRNRGPQSVTAGSDRIWCATHLRNPLDFSHCVPCLSLCLLKNVLSMVSSFFCWRAAGAPCEMCRCGLWAGPMLDDTCAQDIVVKTDFRGSVEAMSHPGRRRVQLDDCDGALRGARFVACSPRQDSSGGACDARSDNDHST